jgi:hypothetical protein
MKTHLTSINPEFERQVARTRPGMAHFAGTGPFAVTCGDCVSWSYWRQIRNASGDLVRTSKSSVLVLISDACEERPADLYNAARELGSVPVFMFQEGDDDHVSGIYAEIARLTGGAHCRFDSGAADLLKAVAAFAAGGVKALAAQKSEAARVLLIQIKK